MDTAVKDLKYVGVKENLCSCIFAQFYLMMNKSVSLKSSRVPEIAD